MKWQVGSGEESRAAAIQFQPLLKGVRGKWVYFGCVFDYSAALIGAAEVFNVDCGLPGRGRD